MQIILVIISTFFLSIYALLLIFYRNSWASIADTILTPESENLHTSISVIIPARNEEENIGECLESILNQRYPKKLFEVIVVDDHSTDKTSDIINKFCGENIHLISLNDFTNNQAINSYKKKAIEIGISKASGDLIVCTDADCIANPQWLQTIASFYEKTKAAFIAAPVSYKKEKGFFKIFQSLDFMTLQGITGASVNKKIHSM